MKKIFAGRRKMAAVLCFGLAGLAMAVHSEGGTPASPPSTPALSLDQVIQKLQDNYKDINTYQAEFEQQLFSVNQGRVVSQGQGTVIYKKPGKMVWRYVKPEEHLYVTEGNTIYDYAPAEKVVYILPIREALYKSFLFGLGDLKKDFEISFHSGRPRTTAGFYQLDLVPKNAADRETVGTLTLIIEPEKFLVSQTESVDALGNRNMIKFKNIKLNLPLDDALFKFTPPPGVQVIKPEEKATDQPKGKG